MRIAALVVLLAATTAAPLTAQERPLGTEREQAAIRQGWVRDRLDRVLPRLMREQGVDMWILPVREYNEDPVFWSIVSPTTMAARRRTIYVFFDRGPQHGVERLAIGGTSQGDLFRVIREASAAIGTAGTSRRPAEPYGPEQWQLLADIVNERNPRTIALDASATHAFSDGLTVGEYEALQAALGPAWSSRFVRRELLALEYIEERIPEMLPQYRRMMQRVHEIIATAFSAQVITPGRTTTDDVVWWLRQRVTDLGLGTWFHPSVNVQRRGVEMGDSASPVIQRGDVLHCDFGITALGLNTDTQHMGYVLRAGETDAPAGLRAALQRGNRLQDLLLAEMQPGRTGNEVLSRTLQRMRSEKIDGSIYTHPIGDNGHGAGPLIGLWDRQNGVPGRGEVKLRANTWFSIELQATAPVAEWDGQAVRMALEEDAALNERGERQWVLRRQEQFHLVH